MATTGIYKIENLINGHIYIGQSINIESRWGDEKQSAFCKTSNAYNYPLSRAFRKYGVDNFNFSIIEECSQDQLDERERYWVKYYDSFKNGYNQTLGGNGGHHVKPKDHIIGIIYDLENTDMYHKEIAKKWNVSQEMVQGINTGRYWKQVDKEYPLQKKHKANSHHYDLEAKEIIRPKNYCKMCGKEIPTHNAKYCIQCYGKTIRKVERPSKEELQEYLLSIKGNFTEAGKNYGVNDNSVRKWCKSYGLPYHSSDYQQPKEIKKFNSTKPKPVIQLDPDTLEPIAEFLSTSEAARAIGKKDGGSHIGAVCGGKRKTAYGYKWKFKE